MTIPLADKREADRFLRALDPNGPFTFQTFDDDQDRKDRHLTRVFHGSLEDKFEALRQLNERGAGVFVTVNATDGRGRSTQNITTVRAVFADLDGSPIEPVLNHPLEPTMVVESSAGRWHAYFVCEDVALDDFPKIQRAIATTFNSDPKVHDLPRVMRLPGFLHQKKKGGVSSPPFQTRIESLYEDAAPYTSLELQTHFKLDPSQPDAPLETRSCVSRSELRSALSHIDPTDRDGWIKVGHALKSEDPDLLAEFLEWSRGDLTGSRPHTFTGDGDVITAWNGFKPERIGISAVINLARENGFQPEPAGRALRLGSQVEVARQIFAEAEREDGAAPVFAEGNFWRFRGTHWHDQLEDDLRSRVHEFDGYRIGKKGTLKLSRSFIDGVLRELAAMSACPEFFESRPSGVNMRNGFVRFDGSHGISLEPHHPEHRQRFLLGHDYISEIAEIPDGLFKRLLNGSLGADQTETHQLVLEIIGAALSGVNTKLKAPKVFVLHGASAANGKSALQALVRALLPASATASVPPADLGDPQFLAMLVGKQVNFSDEISSTKAIASDRFKACITGDAISAKVVYRPPFTFTPTALHIFAANQLPSFAGGVDNGLERRIVVVPFPRSVPESERVPNLGVRIAKEEGGVVIALAVQAAAELLKRGSYSIPASCEAATRQWFRDADPIHEWLEDGALRRHVSSAGIHLRDLYRKFVEDIRDAGVTHTPSKRRFLQRLRDAVDCSGEWSIVRRSNGEMLFPADLLTRVSKVTKFR